MQAHVAHRFHAELRLDGERVLNTPALAVDWTPSVEWCHFQAVRHGAASLTAAPEPLAVRPRWDRESGPPYVAAIELLPSHRKSARPQPINAKKYFATPVRQAVSALVSEGRIAEGASYTWRLCAFESGSTTAGTGADDDGFVVEQQPVTEFALGTCRRPELLRESVHHGPAQTGRAERDVPVIVARRVLDEASAAAIDAGELETGGILLGRVTRDVDDGDLVVELSAQVPASEAVADDASLRFTPQTWQAVHAALRLRRAGEHALGWWHSHPRKVWPCHACPAERRALCPSNHAFFSPMDVAFHRTAFQGAINVALLFSFHEAVQPRHDLFGWRQGLIEARDYYIKDTKGERA